MAEKEFGWQDVSIILLGQTITGITSVSYLPKKAKSASYGAGKSPRSIQHGKMEYSGSITLRQSEIIELNKAARDAGYKNLLDIEVDIIVSYANNFSIKTDRISQASFTQIPYSIKQADMDTEYVIPFIAMDVEEDI